jgi:hypothetical protein
MPRPEGRLSEAPNIAVGLPAPRRVRVGAFALEQPFESRLKPSHEPTDGRSDLKDKEPMSTEPNTQDTGNRMKGRKWSKGDYFSLFFSWPWLIARIIGRRANWTYSTANVVGLAATVALIGVVAVGSSGSTTQPVDNQAAVQVEQTEQPAGEQSEPVEEPASDPVEEPAPDPVEEPASDPVEEVEPEPSEPAITAGQENALEAARSYLDSGAFSRKGLIKQLSSSYGEGFSRADATFAVERVDADWKAEAVESARSYLDSGSFSRSGLIEQLSSSYGENFTQAQAEYAVDKVYR